MDTIVMPSDAVNSARLFTIARDLFEARSALLRAEDRRLSAKDRAFFAASANRQASAIRATIDDPSIPRTFRMKAASAYEIATIVLDMSRCIMEELGGAKVAASVTMLAPRCGAVLRGVAAANDVAVVAVRI